MRLLLRLLELLHRLLHRQGVRMREELLRLWSAVLPLQELFLRSVLVYLREVERLYGLQGREMLLRRLRSRAEVRQYFLVRLCNCCRPVRRQSPANECQQSRSFWLNQLEAPARRIPRRRFS
jgi:hypothetical protein